jgi:hypothetical protein|tara:strand:- start:4466 stop:4684 length:219 start_codon:yes stop_codon:yes gene_type:complete
MTKITITKYNEMLKKVEEEYGAALSKPADELITEEDWENPLIKDQDLPCLKLKWSEADNDWIVLGPLNQTIH